MTKVVTLKDFDDPSFFAGSTAVMPFQLPGGAPSSFSFPPILYYAIKAKKLSAQKISNEMESLYVDIARDTANHIRNIARSSCTDLSMKRTKEQRRASCFIQSRLLTYILGEKESDKDLRLSSKSISINTSRSKKNITIPPYLFKRLSEFMGSEKGARLLIHQTTHDMLTRLLNDGHAETVNVISKAGNEVQQQRLIGDAGNSSWSRKLHNNLIIRLIENSNIEELNLKPSIFDVKMMYEPKWET